MGCGICQNWTRFLQIVESREPCPPGRLIVTPYRNPLVTIRRPTDLPWPCLSLAACLVAQRIGRFQQFGSRPGRMLLGKLPAPHPGAAPGSPQRTRELATPTLERVLKPQLPLAAGPSPTAGRGQEVGLETRSVFWRCFSPSLSRQSPRLHRLVFYATWQQKHMIGE